ncbi:alpha carbonic anhydrase [Baffinella frigidus]|nr:alpha carbonic anhydrase [Cryptophyta sp. CCMP2293]
MYDKYAPAYYSYPGSLTRPPCSEDVTYILLKHSLPIADADLDAIKALQGDNAREPQALHKRLVADSNA